MYVLAVWDQAHNIYYSQNFPKQQFTSVKMSPKIHLESMNNIKVPM